MAYNPGTSFDARPIYEGLASAGEGLAEGYAAHKKKEEQDKDFQARSRATESFLKTHASDLGFSADDVNSLLADDMDETPRAKYLRLSDTLSNAVTGVTLKSQQEDAARAKIKAAQDAERTALEMEKLRAGLAQDQVERGAIKQALDPQMAGLAKQLSQPGASFQDLDPNATEDNPAAGYARAGGGDPQTLSVMAQLARDMTKDNRPVAGSAGYAPADIPGLGTMVIDRATGLPIDGGKVIKPSPEAPEKAMTDQEIQQISALRQSASDLNALEGAYNEIKDPDFGGPVAGRILALNPGNVNVNRINNLVTAATPNLARGVFREKGVLTDQDVTRYQKLLPQVNDTAAQRKQKFADLRARLADSTKETLTTLKNAGRNVDGLQEQILGALPANPNVFKDSDGQQYPVKTIRGQRGVFKGGKFYPILQ